MPAAITRPLEIKDISVVSNKKLKKVITATALGNAVEWFDFSVYGFLATTLGAVFFPGALPSVQVIAALATFAVPFLFRPLGGAVFGILGDKYGRKKILAFTIIMMSLSTAAIGMIPSYAVIGIWAPILLLLSKMIQGLSVGGEYSGAAVFVSEYSPDRRRGFMASWLDFGSIAGFLVGALTVVVVTFLLGSENFDNWGWRIVFFLSLPLGFIGIFLRSSLDESPAYEAQEALSEDMPKRETSPTFMQLLRKNMTGVLICAGLVILTNVTYYMLLIYMPNYLTVNLNYSMDAGRGIIIAVMVGMLFIQPLIGLTSDKIGRKPFILGGASALFILAIPVFWLIISGHVIYIGIGLALLAFILCCMTGVMAATLPAIFSTDIRYSALAITFNIAILVAGLTPMTAAWLVEVTDNFYMPAYYLMVVAVIGFIAGLKLRETAAKPLRGAPPTASNKAEAKELLVEHFDAIEKKVGEIEDTITELEKKRDALVQRHPDLD